MPAASSASFWLLMDRWQVPESQALKLIGYQGKPKKRFKLTNEQARILAAMRQIDDALTIAGIKPSWMHTRSARLRRQTPLERIEAGAVNEVLRILAREALLASVNDENSSSRQAQPGESAPE